MPPRRSNAAAKRAAEDLTDAADDAKRHKADGEPMAAAASSAAAAAVSNSSSAGAAVAASASFSSQRSDAALAAAAAAIPLPDSLDCPVCMESFPAEECKEEGGAGRVPRSLFCTPKPHTYCSACLQRMVRRGVDKEGKPSVTPTLTVGRLGSRVAMALPRRVRALIRSPFACILKLFSLCSSLQSHIRALLPLSIRAQTAPTAAARKFRCRRCRSSSF